MNQLVTWQAQALNPSVPKELARRLLWLSDRARNMGIHIMAGKGSGKSRLMGRIIAWLDFVRGIPLVIFDPHGPTIDNFLDKLVRLPQAWQECLWPRVLYVDMSGRSGRVIPFPLYYHLGGESLYVISQRYLDVVRKVDPFLQTASVEGWNPLWRTGTYAGLILAALDFQITEASSLINDPLAWEGHFNRALELHPEVRPAVEFFRALGRAKENIRSRRSESFSNKVALFTLDPSMQAMFGASQPGVDWNEVIAKRYAVLLDFRHEHDIERRQFKMNWGFNYFMDFIKHRGAGRHTPINLTIDELKSLFSTQTLTTDLLVAELDELINVLARNYMIWLTLAHQELFQLSERAQKTLMAMGTQILGVTSDTDAALSLARQFFSYDAYRIKKREPVYNSYMGAAHIIDYRTVEFTPEEQLLMTSEVFKKQGRFHFLVRPAPGEGDVTGELRPVSIAGFDSEQYTNEELVARARQMLMERRGRKVEEVLSEIESRLESGRKIALVPESRARGKKVPQRVMSYESEQLIFGEKAVAQAQPRRA